MLFDLSHVWENEEEMLVVTGLTLKEAEYVLEDFSEEVKRGSLQRSKIEGWETTEIIGSTDFFDAYDLYASIRHA